MKAHQNESKGDMPSREGTEVSEAGNWCWGLFASHSRAEVKVRKVIPPSQPCAAWRRH